ncbi:hypothetical protein ABIE56_000959 [Luteibacter sp. 621]|uniref:hypothetical protein n=1 Tax=Luteibacter sp. 621 TaxID=3373916 RepID=UPI003D1FC26A
MSRLEQRLQGALAWWMAAPMDEKAAVALLVLPWVIALVIVSAAPAHPLPSPVR